MKKEVAVFGGGCFWCTEAIFKNLKGVLSVTPGYAGGEAENSTYGQVSRGNTGHAEVVKIEFNPEEITYHDLLTVFFATHDPTSVDKQGNDIGLQYRSAIFYADENQKEETESFIDGLNKSSKEGKKIVTETRPLAAFYEAEDYHKNYYEKNQDAPYCQLVINQKLEKVQKEFAELLKNQ